MTLAKSYTIIVDTREKRPLPFPPFIVMKKAASKGEATTTVAIKTVREKLESGDYRARGTRDYYYCGVETKRGLGEMYQNLFTDDRPRFLRSLEALSWEYTTSIVLIENTLSQLLKPTKDYPEPFVILDEMMRVCNKQGVHLLLAPASKRLLTGEFVARLLINATL